MAQLSTTQIEAIEAELESIQTSFSAAQAKFNENFATNPVYALEWNAPLVARTQGAFETIFPLIGVTSKAETEVEHIAGWVERTIEQLEARLLDPSGDMYAPSSSSVTANWLKVETTRGRMTARETLKRILKILER